MKKSVTYLATCTAVVTYRADKTSKTKLTSAFKKIGMEVTPVDKRVGCPVDPAKKIGTGSDYLSEYSIFVRFQ